MSTSNTDHSGSASLAETLSEAEALAILDGGGLVALPTASSFALAGRIDRESAIDALFVLKPDRQNPVGVMAGSREALAPWVISETTQERRLQERYWPGELTLVLDARPEVDGRLLAGGAHSVVAFPRAPFCRACWPVSPRRSPQPAPIARANRRFAVSRCWPRSFPTCRSTAMWPRPPAGCPAPWWTPATSRCRSYVKVRSRLIPLWYDS